MNSPFTQEQKKAICDIVLDAIKTDPDYRKEFYSMSRLKLFSKESAAKLLTASKRTSDPSSDTH